MSASHFKVQEHTLPCQHIRGYPHATLHSQEEVLHLAIKQYTPLNNLSPQPGDVTIIGGHANGFPKELYEPLWDELLKLSKSAGFGIRGIWIADVAHQGMSSVLNESKLGNDPNWFDHPRDLLHMVNTFRAEMPRPIIGIGHSMGGNHLVNLSLMHPRLLETLVLIDPVFAGKTKKENFLPAALSAIRRDRWPSRKAAAESFARSPFYQAWDPRVLKLWIRHGLRDLPTKVYSEPQPSPAATGATVTLEPTVTPNISANIVEKEVTLTTPKLQEVSTFFRPNPSFHPNPAPHELTHPDVPTEGTVTPFYGTAAGVTFNNIPYLRPSVFYMFGETSDLSIPEYSNEKMAMTGTGVGGSGGAKAGRVVQVVVKGAGHLIPMEKVAETGQNAVEWIGKEMARWRVNEELLKKQWDSTPEVEKYTLGHKAMEAYKSLLPPQPPKKAKL
ncbi:Alpha/beta hydrolase family-domain-containing protein [Venturia nashicola]|uniref:Alpha/beta hydrolase family-domain-containing protein n=1 Tax=Venturia nashicola TaxID=86259 RepID=A0A4Z1NZ56_9PEZI|nr:Alpha/beta hydrolase family-domain-containing protein [Venturia nashicola]TLD34531.1 Alpha/beta hydrolase family-domain-containing protein [Venturia nashicola]